MEKKSYSEANIIADKINKYMNFYRERNRRAVPDEDQGGIQMILMEKVVSSNITEIGFESDEKSLVGKMRIRYVGGKLYEYSGVGMNEYSNFKSSESKGKYFNIVFRGAKKEDGSMKYPFTLVDEKAEEGSKDDSN